MNAERHIAAILVAALALTFLSGAASAEEQRIDPAKSTMVVRAYKAGVFSAFGHDHQIAVPIVAGTVDAGSRTVELRVNAARMTVRDPDVSEKDRAEIQRTMLGPEVLDAARYPKIAFRSTNAEPVGERAWRLRGELTLHGETRTVAIEVRETGGGHYTGSARFRQTEFGIRPVKIAGGTVRVKDEVRVEFDIQTVR